jgi:hypothetical protein
MTNNLRGKIKALMTKFSLSSMVEQLTLVQEIDSNDEQIQDIVSKQPLYVYKAILNQSGTNAPEARVLINTFPSGVFSYVGVGQYSLNLGVSVDELNTTTIQQTCYNGTTAFNVVGYSVIDYSIDTYDSTRVAADELLVDYTLVIEAYPA